MTEQLSTRAFFEVPDVYDVQVNAAGKVGYTTTTPDRLQVFLYDPESDSERQITQVKGNICGLTFPPDNPNLMVIGADDQGDRYYALRAYEDITSKDPEVAVVPLTHDARTMHILSTCWSPCGTRVAYTANKEGSVAFSINTVNPYTGEQVTLGVEDGWMKPVTFTPDGEYLIALKTIAYQDVTEYWAYATRPDTSIVDGRGLRVTPDDFEAFYGDTMAWVPGTNHMLFPSERKAGLEPDDPGMRELWGLDFDAVKRGLGQAALYPVAGIGEQSGGRIYDIEGLAMDPHGRLLVVENRRGISYPTLYDVHHSAGRPPTVALAEQQYPSPPPGTIVGLTSTDKGFVVNHSQYDGSKVFPLELNRQPVPFIGGESNPLKEHLSEPEVFTYVFGGFEIDCLLYKPRHWDGDGLMPVGIWIHGGPEDQVRPGDWLPRIQGWTCCDADVPDFPGMAILAPNPPGSTGSGREYRQAANDLNREIPLRIVDGLCRLIGKCAPGVDLSGLDPAKVILMGPSAAGLTVLGCAAQQDPENPLYAGVVGYSAITYLPSFLEETPPSRRSMKIRVYGDPSNPAHLAVMNRIAPLGETGDGDVESRIRVPTRLVHGQKDQQVPPSQPEALYRALLRGGVPVMLETYALEGHGVVDTGNKVQAQINNKRFMQMVFDTYDAYPDHRDRGLRWALLRQRMFEML